MRIREDPVPLMPWLLWGISGILIARVSGVYPGILIIFLFFLFMLSGIILKRRVFLYISVLLFFILNAAIKFHPADTDLYNQLPFEGSVRGRLSLSAVRPYLNLKAIMSQDGQTPVSGRVYLRLEEPPPPFSIVEVKGDFIEPPGSFYPGGYDMSDRLRLEGIHTYIEPEESEYISGGLNFVLKARKYFRDNVRNYLSASGAPLLEGMLLGDPSALSVESVEDFRRAGIMHILAVSGLHSGLVFFAAFFLLSSLKSPRLFAIIISLLLMYGYVLVSGSRPPALRAAINLTLLAAGELSGGRGNLLNSLFFAALVILTLSPGLIFTAGFLLSFLAVFGIAYLGPVLSRYLGSALGVSTSAVIFILPVVAWNFYYLPLLSPLTNLVVIPLASVGVSAGLLMLIASPFFTFAARLFGSASELAVGGIALVGRLTASLPFSGVYAGRPHLSAVLGVYMIFIGVGMRKRKALTVITGILLILAGMIPGRGFIAGIESGGLRSIITHSGRETHIFTDGKGDGYRVLENFFFSEGINRLESLYFLTSPSGNLESLERFIRIFNLSEVYYPDPPLNEYRWELLKDTVGYERVQEVSAPFERKYRDFKVALISDGDLTKSNLEVIIENKRSILLTPYSLNEMSPPLYDFTIKYNLPLEAGGYMTRF